jgi:malonyl CoA-acyl carrier protein transacylase
MKNRSDKKLAFLFPGVGGEGEGFLNALDGRQRETLDGYRPVIKRETGVDLPACPHAERPSQGGAPFHDWVAVYTCSCVVYDTYLDFGIRPHIMLGYSMGLITAMVCGKSISFEAGLHMLGCIYAYSAESSGTDRGMGVIVGRTRKEVGELLAGNAPENDVYIASENSDTCIVISGMKSGVGRVLKAAGDSGAIKASEINAPNAFHSPFAERGIERFIEAVEHTRVCDCETPILSVFDQRLLRKASDLKRELVINLSTPMNWKSSILVLGASGIDSFVEVGPEDSLTKMSRVINIDYDFLTYKKMMR